jgi:hypothetical protein
MRWGKLSIVALLVVTAIAAAIRRPDRVGLEIALPAAALVLFMLLSRRP